MKKLLLLLFLAPLFVACSNTDDSDKSEDLKGKWQYQTNDTIRTIEFKSNGEMKYSGEDTNNETKTYQYTITERGSVLTISGFDYLVKYFITEQDGKKVFQCANSNAIPPANYPLIYAEYDKYTGEDARLVKKIPFIKMD